MIDELFKDEQKRWLYRSIYRLSKKERDILLLSIQSGLKDLEIANIMNLSIENIRVIKHRAKTKLIQMSEEDNI